MRLQRVKHDWSDLTCLRSCFQTKSPPEVLGNEGFTLRIWCVCGGGGHSTTHNVCSRWEGRGSHVALPWLQVASPHSRRNKTNAFLGSSCRSRDRCGKLLCRHDRNILFIDLTSNLRWPDLTVYKTNLYPRKCWLWSLSKVKPSDWTQIFCRKLPCWLGLHVSQDVQGTTPQVSRPGAVSLPFLRARLWARELMPGSGDKDFEQRPLLCFPPSYPQGWGLKGARAHFSQVLCAVWGKGQASHPGTNLAQAPQSLLWICISNSAFRSESSEDAVSCCPRCAGLLSQWWFETSQTYSSLPPRQLCKYFWVSGPH